jgi:hypothetical protein
VSEQLLYSGFRPSIERLKFDLHHLLCIFLASKPLAELVDQEPGYVAKKLQLREVENVEITRLFLTAAITLRVLDDRENQSLDCFSMHCGSLVDVRKQGVEEFITLREACNKIIHATSVEFERDLFNERCQYLSSRLHLKGKHKQVMWHVTIDAYRFVREGIQAIHGM